MLCIADMPGTQQQQRRRAKKKPKDGCGQQQLKLNGHQYVHNCLTMELHMAAQQQLLQAAQQQAAAARTREQVRPTRAVFNCGRAQVHFIGVTEHNQLVT
jgi:hypothetical protein